MKTLPLFLLVLAVLLVTSSTSVWAKRGHSHHRPGYGEVVKVLPRGHHKIHHHRDTYFYLNGIFYSPYDSFYRVVYPPVGLVVSALPYGYVDVRFGNRIYARYNDIYYEPMRRGYRVVEAPPSAPPPPQPDVTAVPASALGTVSVTVEVLNVRSGPSRLHPVNDHVAAGDRLYVLAQAPEWYYVRLPDGGFGWVWRQFVRGEVVAP